MADGNLDVPADCIDRVEVGRKRGCLKIGHPQINLKIIMFPRTNAILQGIPNFKHTQHVGCMRSPWSPTLGAQAELSRPEIHRSVARKVPPHCDTPGAAWDKNWRK